MIYLKTDKFVAKDVLERLASVKDDDELKVSVRGISRSPTFIRITLYHEITDEDVELAIKKWRMVIKEFETNF